jgi:hypothetical protein
LKAHILLIKKLSKTGLSEYKTKYDLSLYAIKLSAKERDKFVLVPKTPSLQKVKFRTLSAEDRNRWFTAIC